MSGKAVTLTALDSMLVTVSSKQILQPYPVRILNFDGLVIFTDQEIALLVLHDRIP